MKVKQACLNSVSHIALAPFAAGARLREIEERRKADLDFLKQMGLNDNEIDSAVKKS